MHWIPDELVSAVVGGLEAAAREADREAAVSGLDARNEIGLHPLIHAALRDAGHGVWPEVRYPADRREHRRNRGRRCDIVLTPDARPLAREPQTSPPLFTHAVAEPPVAEPRLPAGVPVPLTDAYWLEIKTAMQFTPTGAHSGYTSRLLQAASRDILKMAADPGVVHAGLLLVLFVEDARVARHDLGTWHDRCVARDLPLGFPAGGGFVLNDRLGNSFVSVSLFPVR
ncbi:MAG: hypothetical protein ACE5IK_13830 [Acidobacteriota bacterium]